MKINHTYHEFLKSKQKKVNDIGFDVSESELNKKLFDFQKFIVKTALKKGRYAIFADCGLGKTPMQLEWANQIIKKFSRPVLIICPLSVSGQTIEEGIKFGYTVERITKSHLKLENRIYISNYEQLENINTDEFIGIVLDESSILKNFTGVYKNLIIDTFQNTKFKLACTATPAPNDINEIGNHSEFLNVMDSTEMRMRWFVRDEGMNNYRLKGHAKKEFYGWISQWASVLRMPADIGFKNDGYILPKLEFKQLEIITQIQDNGKLFNDISVNATNFNAELRRSKEKRLNKTAEIVNSTKDSFIVWVKQNEEADYLKKIIPDSKEVRGDMDYETKEDLLLGFAKNKFRVLITKSKIAQFGLNYQNCHNQIFPSIDFSFESLYQSIRRSYRFGQKEKVNIYIIKTDTMQNIIESINRKQQQFDELFEEIAVNTNENVYKIKSNYKKKETKSDDYHLINGDSVEEIKPFKSDSIDFMVFSPPFSNLFTYSDNIRDMGNCRDNEEFFIQYGFLIKELYRTLKPGRLMAVHSKDLAMYKNSSGYSGMYDFTGRNHRLIESYGFKYHCKITIWIDPVLEMQRTKAQRLLYKQVTSDSSYSGVGMPEYVTIFRKWEGDEQDWLPVENLTKQNFDLDTWQKIASPVWFDIQRTDVLNNYREGRELPDEKHICPLQLKVIERLIALYTNKGETVLSPFAGIGSEGYVALKMDRKFIGIELKESYYNQAVKNLNGVLESKKQLELI